MRRELLSISEQTDSLKCQVLAYKLVDRGDKGRGETIIHNCDERDCLPVVGELLQVSLLPSFANPWQERLTNTKLNGRQGKTCSTSLAAFYGLRGILGHYGGSSCR
jgi:hypothetical protein